MDDEPKLGWRTLALDHPLIGAHLATELAQWRPTVMLDKASRWGRSHLRLHWDAKGYFVRVGRRGANKQYLGRCNVTYLDGSPTLFAFTLADHDAFEADQERRWLERNGLAEEA